MRDRGEARNPPGAYCTPELVAYGTLWEVTGGGDPEGKNDMGGPSTGKLKNISTGDPGGEPTPGR